MADGGTHLVESMGTLPTRPDRREADAGAISLEIAELAGQNLPRNILTRQLASLLQHKLAANAVAFFWAHQNVKRSTVQSQLRTVAVQVSTGLSWLQLERSMKMSAYRALSKQLPVERELASRASAVPGHLVAIPIGNAAPWGICVAWWSLENQVGGSLSGEKAAALFLQLRASLTSATLPAHLDELSRRAEYEQSERRAIFAATSEAILSIGSDFVIRESNPAFLRTMGWQDNSPVNRKCPEVLGCRDSRKITLCGTEGCPLQQALLGETPLPVQELYWETSTGQLREISASFTAHPKRDVRSVVVVARDDSLVNAANRMKSNFISMISHELRTPLNSINGFIEIVVDGQVGPLNPRQQEFLGYVQSSALQLTTLVEDILFISKADSGQFLLRPGTVDVVRLVDQTRKSVSQAAQKAEIQITASLAEYMLPLRGDELRLQQVITNLLHNAIKCSPSGEQINLRVQQTGPFAEFAVVDHGRGVPPEEHSRIFERFYQSESSQHATRGGYGLGLAIAKLIVEQHGGRIWLESAAGKGATFFFTVPLALPQAGSDSSESPEL